MSSWLFPVIPIDPATSFVERNHDPERHIELGPGSKFRTKENLEISVGLMCLKSGREARLKKSDPTRVYFKCIQSDNCSFDVRASAIGKRLRWGIYKFITEHTCSREVGVVLRINAHANVVATWLAHKIHDDADLIKSKTIQNELQVEFGVQITYDLALRARNLALEMIYGSHDASYQLLPSYLPMLRDRNPGSQFFWDVGPDGRFRHYFVAFGITIRNYLLSSLRPVIVIDGTHMKGKDKSVIFITATKDGNEQLFPLAYGVGPKENDESWGWFLSKFVLSFGAAEPLLVVSDQHKSIANAVRKEMPFAQHAYCYYHIAKNLSGSTNDVKELFAESAYAYDGAIVDQNMTQLQGTNPKVWRKFMEIGVEKWVRAKCPIKRYSFLTSNAAESFNSRLKWARRLPICSLLESMRVVIDDWNIQKCAAVASRSGVLTYEAHMANYMYKVRHDARTVLVDLYERTCECGVFQSEEFPCSHAIAAIMKQGRPILDYVGVYYTRESLNDVYSGTIR